MDEYTRNKMPAEAGRRIEERRQEFNAAWDKEEARQKLLAEEKRTLECVNAMLGIPDPAATMKEVREVVSSLTKIIEDMRIDEDFDASTNNAGGICFGDVSSDALVAARALLSKLGGE